MNHDPAMTSALHADIVACGYFPDLVEDAIRLALAEEAVRHYVVHHEPTFNRDEIHRHVTILVLTDTRLIVGHTDESVAEPGAPVTEPRAISSTESLGLDRVNTVSLTRVLSRPAEYRPEAPRIAEAWLGVGWGAMRRLDLEPAACEDPSCDADHGFTGTLAADDLIVRMSEAADGARAVQQLIAFGGALQRAAGVGDGSVISRGVR